MHCPVCGQSLNVYRTQCGLCGHLMDAVKHHEILQRNGSTFVGHTFRCTRCNPTFWERFTARLRRILGREDG